MNNKWVAISVVLLAIVLGYLTLAKPKFDKPQLLLPQFSSIGKQAQILTIQSGQQLPLRISFNAEVAKADSYHGYQVDVTKLRAIMLQLQQLKIRQRKTSKQANYHYLGLDEAQRLLISLQDGAEDDVLILHLGKEAVGGRFARLSSQAQSYLVDWQIPVSKTALQWLDRSIVGIDTQVISSISNERGLRLGRSQQAAELAIEGVTGQVKDYEVSRLSALFSGWQFLDVQPLSEEALFKPELITITLLSKPEKIVLATGKHEGKYWVFLHSSTTAVPIGAWLFEISEYDYELITADNSFFMAQSVPETESQ